MLRFGMLSLICSMSFAVFGFGGGMAATWVTGRILFLVCLVFAMVGFLVGVMHNAKNGLESRLDDQACPGRSAQEVHDV